ncbi:hypothetical protein K3495_g11928 [Podosphaera aphanis]|nr:hypothetical protein K3495_g11928 [Podosphaera aphanis]
MLNFGVCEVLSTKSVAAPGWAYVAEHEIHPSPASLHPTSRKRARTSVVATPGGAVTTAKHEAKLVRELAALDRDNTREVAIAIPTPHRAPRKLTPAVRKILQSHKTFANHLADYEAHAATTSSLSLAAPAPATPTLRTSGAAPSHTRSRSLKKRDPPTTSLQSSRKASVSSMASRSGDTKTIRWDSPTTMALTLSNGHATVPMPHPADQDPLLVSRIPTMPSQEELERLLSHPPLSYLEARGPWVPEDRRKPLRVFCEKCGYWGRVKCTKCGRRVCGLECYKEHAEECLIYGP